MTDQYPQFRTVLRGHDPTQVDEVLDDLYAALDDAERQAETSSATLERERAAHRATATALEQANRQVGELKASLHARPTPSFETLGSRVASILSTAEEEATEKRLAAEGQAAKILEAARTSAADMLEQARSSAGDAGIRGAEILASAREQGQRIVAEAEARAGQVRAQEEQRRSDLTAHHARLRGQLSEVRAALAAALSARVAESPQDGPPAASHEEQDRHIKPMEPTEHLEQGDKGAPADQGDQASDPGQAEGDPVDDTGQIDADHPDDAGAFTTTPDLAPAPPSFTPSRAAMATPASEPTLALAQAPTEVLPFAGAAQPAAQAETWYSPSPPPPTPREVLRDAPETEAEADTVHEGRIVLGQPDDTGAPAALAEGGPASRLRNRARAYAARHENGRRNEDFDDSFVGEQWATKEPPARRP